MCPVRQTLSRAFVAATVAATSAIGQQIMLQQQDGITGQFSVSVGGSTITSVGQMPQGQEQKALGIMRRDTHRRREAIEAEVLLQALVSASLTDAKKAMAAFCGALGNSEDYALLQEEKAALNEERQGLYRSGSGVEPKERRQKHKELSQRLEALNTEIAEFAETIPEIRALAEQKTKAVDAFIAAFETACKAHPKWAALEDDTDDITNWTRQASEQRGDHTFSRINVHGK